MQSTELRPPRCKIVTSFQSAKIVDYLVPGKSVCIWFNYGLKEISAFYPLVLQMRSAFEETQIDLAIPSRFCGLFSCTIPIYDDSKVESLTEYDYVFFVGSPLFSNFSKVDTNYYQSEIIGQIPVLRGQEDTKNFWPELEYSPFIAVDFGMNTAADEKHEPIQYDDIVRVCDVIRSANYIPIDVHYWENETDFVPTLTTIDSSATRHLVGHLEYLTSVLKCCYGYVGVFEESFLVARQIFPEHCMCILRPEDEYARYMPLCDKCKSVELKNDFWIDKVKKWLDDISGKQVETVSPIVTGQSAKRGLATLPKTSNEETPRHYKLRAKKTLRPFYVS